MEIIIRLGNGQALQGRCGNLEFNHKTISLRHKESRVIINNYLNKTTMRTRGMLHFVNCHFSLESKYITLSSYTSPGIRTLDLLSYLSRHRN